MMNLYSKTLGTDPPLLVADCWSTSEGILDTALALVQHIHPYVDVVKFTGYTDHRFDLHDEGLSALWQLTQELNIGFMLTPVQVGWVRNAAQWGEAIKIASGDLLHRELIEAAAATGKPLILSTGWATVDDMWRLKQYINGPFMLMHAVSAYPTPVDQANVHALTKAFWMWQSKQKPIGYSNHVSAQEGGFEACCAAVALGASIIEVHATLSRTERVGQSTATCGHGSRCQCHNSLTTGTPSFEFIPREFHDHQVAFLPDELRDLRQRLDYTHACLGSGVKEPQPCELANIEARRWK